MNERSFSTSSLLPWLPPQGENTTSLRGECSAPHTHTHKPSQRKRTESGSWYLRVLIQPLLTHITQDGPCALSHSSQPHRGQVRCQSRPAGEDAQAAERAAPLCPQMRALPSPHLRPSLGSCTSCLAAGFSQREALAEDGRRGGSVA